MTRVAVLFDALIVDPTNSLREYTEFSTEANQDLVISLLMFGYDPYRFPPMKVINVGSFDFPRYRIVDGLIRCHLMRCLNARAKNAGIPEPFNVFTVEIVK